MKKLYVYLTHNYSRSNDIMRSINVHIVFRHIETLLIQTFDRVPNSRNLIIRKCSFFKGYKIRVLNDLVSLLWTRIAENNLSKLFHDLNPCNADNLRHGLPTEKSVIKIECLQGSFEYICY